MVVGSLLARVSLFSPSSATEASKTIAGVMRVMQRWSSGQIFFWHGPQKTFTATCRSFA